MEHRQEAELLSLTQTTCVQQLTVECSAIHSIKSSKQMVKLSTFRWEISSNRSIRFPYVMRRVSERWDFFGTSSTACWDELTESKQTVYARRYVSGESSSYRIDVKNLQHGSFGLIESGNFFDAWCLLMYWILYHHQSLLLARFNHVLSFPPFVWSVNGSFTFGRQFFMLISSLPRAAELIVVAAFRPLFSYHSRVWIPK